MGADGHLTIAAGAWAERQRTLKNPIHCSGTGVHSGRKVHMTLRPAPAGSGIVFYRSDLDESVSAIWSEAIETPLCTTLALPSGEKVATVEHLLSAFLGLGVDNALVELDGPEVPIMDGSAAPFVFLIECAGIEEQDAPRRRIEVLKAVGVDEESRSAHLAPAERFAIDFAIEFPNPLIRCQRWQGLVTPPSYKREIARARTFGFLEDVETLRARGLALGGSLENAIVIDGTRILNEGGLRFADEFVRHKVLDAVGDLYLAGAPLIGRFSADRAGHALTLRLLRTLFADPEAWRWVEPGVSEEGELRPARPAALRLGERMVAQSA